MYRTSTSNMGHLGEELAAWWQCGEEFGRPALLSVRDQKWDDDVGECYLFDGVRK